MRPVLFSWRGHAVSSYAAMLYLGLVAGVVAGNATANVAGIDSFRFFVATLLLLTAALIGARIAYVVAHWEIYRSQPERIWDRSEGGYAQDGGIIVVVLLAIPLFVVLGLPVGASLDAAGLAMLVVPIFARVGCLLHGCCAGRPTTGWLRVHQPDHRGVWADRIPTQILEAAWAALLLGLAVAVWGSLPFSGALFLLLMALYNLGRILLLSLRDRQSNAYTPALQIALTWSMIILPLAVLARLWPHY